MISKKQNLSFISITSHRISNNGSSFKFNALYANVNGKECGLVSMGPCPLPGIGFGPSLFDEISNNKQKNQNSFKTLENIHKRNLQRTKSQFYNLKNIFENLNDDELDELTRKKEKELKELEQKDSELEFDDSKTNYNDNFMIKNSKKIDEKIASQKKKIDQKYRFNKPKLELNEDEKEKMANYTKEIKKLKNYSNHENYDDVMDNFSLYKYMK